MVVVLCSLRPKIISRAAACHSAAADGKCAGMAGISMTPLSRQFLLDLFNAAVKAAHPAGSLPALLPPPPKGRLIVLAAGKGAGSMSETAEAHYLDLLKFPAQRLDGIAVARHGYGRPTRRITMVEAGHPVPDEAGLKAAERALALADSAGADDLVLVLMSGGASANWIAPAEGLTFADKQAVTRALLRSGANIGEINTVRKHLSRIKGGRLARHAYPAKVVTLAISDVPRDEPSAIGSGPTVPDPTNLADARAVAARYRLDLPEAVTRALTNEANETPKPGDAVFANTSFTIVARPLGALEAVETKVKTAGYECVSLGDRVEGEARDVAATHGRLARDFQAQGKRAVIVSGGELTVTIRGNGRGGPNQEYALALALALDGTTGISALAADTDGTDGGAGSAEDPAGAFADGTTAARARALGLDPAAYLADNNSTEFFLAVGGLLQTGPTYTNVNDLRVIVVDRG
jgi:hydroxypyruvate reductase